MKRILAVLLLFLMLAGCAEAPIPTTGPTTPSSLPTVPTIAPTVPTTAPTEPPETRVSDFRELAQAADNVLPGDTVRVTGDFEITEPVVFGTAIRLIVDGSLVCTAPIVFETLEEGTIEILTESPGLDIRLDAPRCQVLWPGQMPWGTPQEQAAYCNVAAFNGVELGQFGLGGTGREKLAAIHVASENLTWTVDGNTAYLALSYLVGDPALENVTATVTTASGEVREEILDLSPGVTHYTVTDAQGDSRTYQIVTTRIAYELPVFHIEIENDAEVTSKETYLNATVRVENGGELPNLDTTAVLIRGRGHFSWQFDKKPYKLRFEKKTSVLGMNASKNWVLLANYVDRSLIQNHVAMEMGKVMDHIPYHSNQYPVDVFVNGTYRGVYTFGEQLEAKKERIDLEESYTEVDTDYLLEVGGYDEGDVKGRDYFHAGTLRYIAIKHPDTVQMTWEQFNFISTYVNDADRAVRRGENYEDYIDVESLIDWVILHELSYNLDCCFRRSCYLIKEKGGKLKMGPIWDFDLAFGSFNRYDGNDWATVGETDGYVAVTWMNYLMKDEAFMARFTARWNEVKEELLAAALNAVDTAGALVAPSAEMNFQVWNILGQPLNGQPWSHTQYDTYEKMLGRLKSCIQERYDFLERELNPTNPQ